MYLIMKTLWLRLEEREEKWRHCYKALNVIEYLVAHGSESCLKELKQNVRTIEYLDTFRFVDPSGRDQGINAAEERHRRADPRRRARGRGAPEKAKRNRGKFSGISPRMTCGAGRTTGGAEAGERGDDRDYRD